MCSKNDQKAAEKKLPKNVAKKICVTTIHGFALQYLLSKEFVSEENMVTSEELNDKLAEFQIDIKDFSRWERSFSICRRQNKQCCLFYQYLEDNGLWTYDYCINREISKNTQELMRCRCRWKYFIVDEYQDCNANQIELLRLLRNDKNSSLKFLFVGDPDQMIYEWRGARSKFSVDIRKFFPSVSTHSLH